MRLIATTTSAALILVLAGCDQDGDYSYDAYPEVPYDYTGEGTDTVVDPTGDGHVDATGTAAVGEPCYAHRQYCFRQQCQVLWWRG